MAIGAAYATSIGGAETKELVAAGLNRSDVHVDFMIGSSQMDIDGIREDGTRVPSSAMEVGNLRRTLCLEVCLFGLLIVGLLAGTLTNRGESMGCFGKCLGWIGASLGTCSLEQGPNLGDSCCSAVLGAMVVLAVETLKLIS